MIYATVQHPDRSIYRPERLVQGPYDGFQNLPEAMLCDFDSEADKDYDDAVLDDFDEVSEPTSQTSNNLF